MKKEISILSTIVMILCIAFCCSQAKADCDVSTLKEEMIAPYRKPLPVDSTECKGFTGHNCKHGIAIAKNFKFTESPFEIKGETFVILNFDVTIKFANEPDIKSKMQVVRSVDMGSCTLEIYDHGEMFGTSVK